MTRPLIRPLLPEDVPAAADVTWAAFADLDVRTGHPPAERTPEAEERGRLRVAHLQRTDPGCAWVAEVDGEVVGCSVALVREGMWFLSLLMVRPGRQSGGLGRQLLEAALTTSTDRSWITSTVDARALRRYQRAGFALHPTYTAHGPVDRALLPAVGGVRAGDWQRDGDLVDAVARATRGATVAPDLPYLDGLGLPLVVVDDAGGRGFAVLRSTGQMWVAATTDDAARRLL
ncbi:MAG: GNAT family N-acetyltransferase, partial [Mycobacteriales bacterium]